MHINLKNEIKNVSNGKPVLMGNMQFEFFGKSWKELKWN